MTYKKRDRSQRSSSEEHATNVGHDTDYVHEPTPQPSVRTRSKHAATKPPTMKAVASRVKTLKNMGDKEYRDMRRVNQYDLLNSAGRDEDNFFHTDLQERIYNEVVMIHDKPYASEVH